MALLHLLFQMEIGEEEDMLRASYWISETKREAQNYWRKIFIYAAALVYLLFLCNIFLAVVKVSCSGQSNNGRTMGSWHTALFAKLTQNHQTSLLLHFLPPPSSPYWLSHRYIAFWGRKYTRNTRWYGIFTAMWWIKFKCNGKATWIFSSRLIYPLKTNIARIAKLPYLKSEL